MSYPRYRMAERQRIYDKFGEIAEKMLATTDKDQLNSLKFAMMPLTAMQAVIDTYEKGLRDQQKIDNTGVSGSGITIPQTEER